jgi:membrane associated rhomboid family serine protease
LVIPVYDENHRTRGMRPWVMWTILALNVLALLYLLLLPADTVQALAFHFGVVPGFITKAVDTKDYGLLIPPLLTLGTYTFLHGSWLHLAGNMIFLWVFGDNIEAAMGHLRFVLFYLLCGIAGGLAHVASDPSSLVPLVGASGAVSGVLAAYLMLRPMAHVTVLLFGIMTFQIHAYWFLATWIAWQAVNLLLFQGGEVSYWSHFGGLLAGALLIVVMRTPGVKLFQAHRAPPGQRQRAKAD